mmetsp:Transcript_18769/g.59010  ORF Transcript_18769/g.59010 Transcript_18769/m.59010 type:complete len:205 (-) Transcript_18769:314-928(-)
MGEPASDFAGGTSSSGAPAERVSSTSPRSRSGARILSGGCPGLLGSSEGSAGEGRRVRSGAIISGQVACTARWTRATLSLPRTARLSTTPTGTGHSTSTVRSTTRSSTSSSCGAQPPQALQCKTGEWKTKSPCGALGGCAHFPRALSCACKESTWRLNSCCSTAELRLWSSSATMRCCRLASRPPNSCAVSSAKFPPWARQEIP